MTLTTCTTPNKHNPHDPHDKRTVRGGRGEQVCQLVEVTGPVGRDFPFEICCGCGFPILPADLAGDAFRHWHASTCTPATLLAMAGGERR